MKLFKTRLIILGLLLSLLVSCKRDFLASDFAVSTAYSQTIVFSTWLEAQKVLTHCYSFLPNYSGLSFRTGAARSGTAHPASYTDEATNSFLKALSWNVTGGNFSSQFNPDDIWSVSYQAIRRCNVFLENIDKVTDIDPATILRSKNEVRMLRAFYYFELFKRYGGVPLLKNSLDVGGILTGNLDVYNIPRSTTQATVDFIISDLDSAIKYLPAVQPTADLGRATKLAAMGYKGRLLLYYASPLHNTSNDLSRWQAASVASKLAIDSAIAKGAVLNSSYINLFTSNSRTSKEIIWLVCQNLGGSGNSYDLYERPVTAGGACGTNPTVNHIDKYEMINGMPISDPSYNPNNPFANRDPRLGFSVVKPGEVWFGKPFAPWWGPGGTDGRSQFAEKPADGSWTGMILKKFVDQGQAANRNWPLMRLAELYLNYAEALNEFSGPQADAFTFLNKNRLRTGVAMPLIPNTLSKDSLRKRIRNERAVELAFEEHRNFDARRWKTAKDEFGGVTWGFRVSFDPVANTFSYPKYSFQNRVYKSHWDFYPIPQGEIDKSKGILLQNPGY